jgi:hypothetical protein
VTQAAMKIERAIADLLDRTLPMEHVAHDYLIERLIDELIERNPRALDYFNSERGEAPMRLVNALMDWHDMWGRR